LISFPIEPIGNIPILAEKSTRIFFFQVFQVELIIRNIVRYEIRHGGNCSLRRKIPSRLRYAVQTYKGVYRALIPAAKTEQELHEFKGANLLVQILPQICL